MSNAEDIVLTNGASSGIALIMGLLKGPNVGMLCPVPQYPLYSAQATLLNTEFISYYLSEENGWQLDMDSLQQNYDQAVKRGLDIRYITIINPGNPTGSILTEQSLKNLFQFSFDHGLVVLADEVYQMNIYSEKKQFISAKKVLRQMEPEIANSVELFSFHSTSKGLQGECGYRGGYFEMVNISQEGRQLINKLQSIALCSNVNGQLMTDLMINHPRAGVDSSETVAFH
jgi:alanine transaminase